MKKALILVLISIAVIVSFFIFIGLPASSRISYKAWLNKTCEVAQAGIKIESEPIWTILNFKTIRSISYRGIKGDRKEYIQTDFSGVFQKPKSIVIKRQNNSYILELLNNTSCGLIKYFNDDPDHVFTSLIANPWPLLKQIFESGKPVTVGYLKQLSFIVIEKNQNNLKLHAYPALSVEVEVKFAENCKESNCDDVAEVIKVNNIYRQLVVEDDFGNIMSKTEPQPYGYNKQVFPVLLRKTHSN